MKCKLAPEFIEQITKEVIKKIKEERVNFEKLQLPSEQIPIVDVNKVKSNAGSSVIMDEEGVVTAKVGDTSVTTTKEGIIGKVDSKTSNSEEREIERGGKSITVNIKTSDIIQELINSYVKSLEEIGKAMKEFGEKANCEIEALKGEVNSLKVENCKLKRERIAESNEEIDIKHYEVVEEYLIRFKNTQLENLNDNDKRKVIRIVRELADIPSVSAISILDNCKTIIPCISIVTPKKMN